MTEANHHISTLGAFNLAAISAALVSLGPGAFSLDAGLFGRREIIIPEGPAFTSSMIPRNIPHLIEIERNSCAPAWASNPPYNSGIRSAPFTGVENAFLRGMQSSECSFIVTTTESYESLIL